MIEFFSLLGFFVINTFVKNNYIAIFPEILKASIVLCTSFLLFGRTFVHMVKYKVWKANIRHFGICSLYANFLIHVLLTVFYFAEGSAEFPGLRLSIQLYNLLLYLVVFIITGIPGIKDIKLYGRHYLILQILDTVSIVALLLFGHLYIQDVLQAVTIFKFICIILTVLTFLSFRISNMKTFWLHKNALLSIFEVKARCEDTKGLVEIPKKIKESILMREAAYVLDNAVFRVVEVNLLVKQLHDTLVANGKTTQEATNVASDFGAAIMKCLMKRKYDFYLLPRPIVKLLQTYSTKKSNKRKFLLTF